MTQLEWCKEFGRRLGDAMEEVAMNQEMLANLSGVDQSSISRLRNGKLVPTIRTVVNIANALGCDVSFLVNTTDRID